jgi:hypothetical protein
VPDEPIRALFALIYAGAGAPGGPGAKSAGDESTPAPAAGASPAKE